MWDMLVERHASAVAAHDAAVVRVAGLRVQCSVTRALIRHTAVRRRGIQGGSGPSDEAGLAALHEHVREALRRGTLPLLLNAFL
jgi:hypothetical protein